jgi:hypothetical protein
MEIRSIGMVGGTRGLDERYASHDYDGDARTSADTG